MKPFAEIDIENKGNYIKLLSAVAKLSGLFSESAIPFINYRVAENVFCKSFNADNLSRSDTAFDANYKSVGIGLKTFTCPNDSSTEKIAEFNSLSKELTNFKGKELALKLAEFRNERIKLANRLYNIDKSLYHIVARKDKKLVLFETDYNLIDIENIHSIKENSASLQFEDGNDLYRFNYSKSTLFKKFIIPQKAYHIPIEIIEDPYKLLLELFEDKTLKPAQDMLKRGVNYVILPLYGIKNQQKFVFEKSGLNQWNAGGRKRDLGEVYIPIPSKIHRLFPTFFPEREVLFKLQIPTGEKFTAKVCQDNSKALMTNPNKALSDWLLRKVFQLEEGELATYQKMNKLGFDSVIIIKENNNEFKIDKAKLDSYEYFINNLEIN
ncbi:restriction endonuclease [Weeksellaceae bacterium TAE3-ERU29]|nr:restriction endonuclease [Weeksellaceae bacterium TAE3-ERU29]